MNMDAEKILSLWHAPHSGATQIDHILDFARRLRAELAKAEPVAWRCQLVKDGDWFYLLTHPDLADNSPWETIVPLNRQELQQEIIAMVKDRKSLNSMATLLAKARTASPPIAPATPAQASPDMVMVPRGKLKLILHLLDWAHEAAIARDEEKKITTTNALARDVSAMLAAAEEKKHE